MNFIEAMKLCDAGLSEWKSKQHNAKWWKRIDGTPIPNDLLVNIAQQFVTALALPEDCKTVNAWDDGWPKLDKPARVGNTTFAPRVSSRLVVECAQRAYEYKLREASGEPMPYRVVRDGDKVRFE